MALNIEEFEKKVLSHLQQFVDAVNENVEDNETKFNDDIWWERFTEFSIDLENK